MASTWRCVTCRRGEVRGEEEVLAMAKDAERDLPPSSFDRRAVLKDRFLVLQLELRGFCFGCAVRAVKEERVTVNVA